MSNYPSITSNASIETWLEKTKTPVWPDGTVRLYKAVDDKFMSHRSKKAITYGYDSRMTSPYTVGATLTAPDFKKVRDCGNGLHLSPTPVAAAKYHMSATRYVEVQINKDDIVPLHSYSGDAPKCKVHTLKVVREVQKNFDPIKEHQTAMTKAAAKARRSATPGVGDLIKSRKSGNMFKIVGQDTEQVCLHRPQTDSYKFVKTQNLQKSFALAW